MQGSHNFFEAKCSNVRLSWSDHQTKTFSQRNASLHVLSIQISRFDILKRLADPQDEEGPEKFKLPTLQTSGQSFELPKGTRH